MTTYRRWEDGRPIYYSLPGENEGYLKDAEFNDPINDPPIADWLTEYWDELLIETQALAQAFPANYLMPETCRPDALDWLAQHAGFTGNYWDATWPDAIKRELIANAYSFIWENKGTRILMEYLVNLFGLQASVFVIGDFLAGITLIPAALGMEPYTFYLVVGLIYLRTSAEWALLEKLRVLYSPVYCDSRVCYEQFYAGFSVADDPVFAEMILGRHPDTIAYAEKILASGGTIDDYTLTQIDLLFVRPLYKYKAKFTQVLLLCGSNLTAATRSLWGADATPVNFTNADYSQATGLKGDGLSKYLNLNVVGSSLNASSVGLLVYGSELETAAHPIEVSYMGALQGIPAPVLLLGRAPGAGLYAWANNTTNSGLILAADAPSNAFSQGMLSLSATATGLKMYRDSTPIASGAFNSNPLPNQNLYAFARSFVGPNPNNYSAMRCKFLAITTGLSDAEQAEIYAAVLNLNTALSRA